LFLLFVFNFRGVQAEKISNKNSVEIINNSLSNTLSVYIKKISHFFPKNEYETGEIDCAYYCVLFFAMEKENYFMLFTSAGIPKYFYFVRNKNIYFYLHNNKKIALIDCKKNKNPLFVKTKEAIENANKEAKKDLCFIQDGSTYPETYKYKIENGKVLIEKTDSLFYESIVGVSFARFENLHITLPNGYRKNKTHNR
jgi:hypothetical protein